MRLFAALILLAASAATPAQQPQILHAQLTTEAAPHGLAAELQTLARSPAPLWAGYSIATVAPFHSGWQGSPVAYLESRNDHSVSTDDATPAQGRAVILLRLAGGKVDQLRAEAPDRALDAGDLGFVWLSNITPEDSVATLESIALAPASTHLRDTAIFLIAEHASPAAVPALVALAAPANEPAVREKAAFWLANQRGHEGFLAVQKLDREDADPALREKLTFDLTLSKDPGALDELIRMARADASPRVRSQAQFWMSQQAGKRDGRAVAAGLAAGLAADLRRSAEADPDGYTRKQAVFAISRLPADQAFTQLSELASTSKYPEVRRQAVFWLGQSKDPRALDYLARLLKSDH